MLETTNASMAKGTAFRSSSMSGASPARATSYMAARFRQK